MPKKVLFLILILLFSLAISFGLFFSAKEMLAISPPDPPPEPSPPPTEEIQTLTLSAGWNMISPDGLEVSLSDLKALNPDCQIDLTLWYNTQAKKYETPQILEPLKGYLVQAKKSCEAKLKGKSGKDTLTLYPGWNLFSTIRKKSFNEINVDCQPEKKIQWLVPGTKQYQAFAFNDPLEPKRGYWVFIANNQVCQIKDAEGYQPPPEKCECQTGPCCDGCNFYDSSKVCNQSYETGYGCKDGEGCGKNVYKKYKVEYCSGNTSGCDGKVSDWLWGNVVDTCDPQSKRCEEGKSTCVYDKNCLAPDCPKCKDGVNLCTGKCEKICGASKECEGMPRNGSWPSDSVCNFCDENCWYQKDEQKPEPFYVESDVCKYNCRIDCTSNGKWQQGACNKFDLKKQCAASVCTAQGWDISKCVAQCTSHTSKSCSDNNVYWYDSCQKREEKAQECGQTSFVGNWIYYCDPSVNENVIFRKRDLISRGCEQGACFEKPDTTKEPYQNCPSGQKCIGGSCMTLPPACTPHTSKACYDKDIYWYNSCGNREEKAQECGQTSWVGDWTYYCDPSYSDKIVFRKRDFISRGCENNACYATPGTERDPYQNCPSGQKCINGACATPPPTCTSKSSKSCYDKDVYWYDSCGKREEKSQECGQSYWDNWSSQNNYCQGNDVYTKRSYYEKGCQNNSCYTSSYEETKKITSCGTDYCESSTEKVCQGNSVYKKKKCWSQGCSQSSCFAKMYYDYELEKDCASNEECKNGQCVKITPTCTPKTSKACYDNDVYWYDSCGNKDGLYQDCGNSGWSNYYQCSGNTLQRGWTDMGCANDSCYSHAVWKDYENCGSSYCDTWGSNFCSGNYVARKTTCYDRGCSNNKCYYKSYESTEILQTCTSGQTCKNGQCVAIPPPACTPHTSKACYDKDVYWYNSCGNKEEKAQECGQTSWVGDWTYYCDPSYGDKIVFRKRDLISRGCEQGACYATPTSTRDPYQNCPSGQKCENGKCVAAYYILSASCIASPYPANINQIVTFTANASGGTTGSYSYSWSGACTGGSKTCSKSFPLAGTYTATVTVTSGSEKKSANCSVWVKP